MSNEFWTSTGRYGVICQAERASRIQSPGCLVVFVHGLFGDCQRTWARMPEWVIERSGVEVDVASFSYPAQIWQRTSISQAADDLRTWLETEFLNHRQLVFVTHSTGGLVVKQMLRQAFREIEAQLQAGSFDFPSSSSVWLRTRQIINIAVPHTGGSPFITAMTKTVYRLGYPLIAPLLGLIRFLSQGAKDWGWNDLMVALRWQNPWLLELEEEFLTQQGSAMALDIPCPMVHDLYAKSDLSVPLAADLTQRNIYFRGTHGSVKVPHRANDPIVAIVASFVGRYGADLGLLVTDRTLARIAEVNKVTGTHSLIGATNGEQVRKRASPTVKTSSFGTQIEICDKLRERVRAGSERPRQIVVTGVAGVGKSTVLRMIAGRLGCDYLANPDQNPLPLLLPLQQVTLEKATEEIYSWKMLWQWWIHWARSLYPGLDDRVGEWLEERFRTTATTVILDGLDDFLVNHPFIGLSSIVTILRDAVNRYASNPRFSIIVGIRSGVHGLQRLATDPKDIYEVLRLSVYQAEQVFPACRRWLPCVTDHGLLDLVLTPLILSNYEPEVNGEIDPRSLSQSSIMDQTIRTILRRSGLIGIRTQGGQIAEIDHLMLALTLIAWLFFYRHRGEIEMEALREEARMIREQWALFFQDQHPIAEAQDVTLGFRLVEEASICNAILQRTVFVSTGSSRVRFTHRSWQEFLLAQYFVLCLRWGHVENFGITAFNSHIYRMAGESFKDSTITEDQIRAVLASWRNSHNTYISGNVIAFLAWTRTAIDPRAIQLLLNELANFEALSRVVLIAGLGYRVLVNDPKDPSIGDLRRMLFPKLGEFSNPQTAPVDDPVACSLAWCYRKAFAGIFGMRQPEIPWPAIGFDEAETLKALPMICTVRDGERVLDARSRSLQLAFLVPILDAYTDPNLAIRALHYLYYLVVARRHEVHVFELSQELPQILASGGRFEKIIESFTLVPEALELFRRCQAAHSALESAVA